MELKTFTWNNGTQSSPIVLSTDQIKKLLAIGKKEGLEVNVSGCITTSSRKMQKFLKYALEQQYPNLNVICDEELADSFRISLSNPEIKEGSREVISISTDTGITHDFLKWKYEFTNFQIDGDISEQNIKDRIRVEDGHLVVDDPKENASWSCQLTLTAYPVYYNEAQLGSIPAASKPDVILNIVAKKIENINVSTKGEFPLNSEVTVEVTPVPSDATKLKGATYTYTTDTPDIVSILTSTSGTTITTKKQGQGSLTVTLHACNNTVTVSNKVTFNVYDLRPVCYTIDQRWQGVTDPVGMVSVNFVIGSDGRIETIADRGADGNISNNTLTWLRQNTHAYVGRYTGMGQMRLKQLKDDDLTKFADGTSAIGYIDNEEGKYDVWMKINSDVYIKTEAYTPTGQQQVNEDYILVQIAREIPTGEDTSKWRKFDKNRLYGVYEACQINNQLFSVSGQQPVNNISQSNSKARARARGYGFRIVDYDFSNLLAYLFYGYYKTLDSQTQCGYGTANVVSGTYYPKITGQTNQLEGDTTTVTGNGETTPDNDQIIAGQGADIKSNRFWFIENFQGDVSEWLDDMMVMQAKRPSGNANPAQYLDDYCNEYGYPKITKQGKDYQLTKELLDEMNANQRFVTITDKDGSITRIIQHGDFVANSEGYIKKMCFGEHADLFPKEFAGSASTGFCDYGHVHSAGYVALRSNYSVDASGGVGCLRLSVSAGSTGSGIGSRLMFEGDDNSITIIDDATETL